MPCCQLLIILLIQLLTVKAGVVVGFTTKTTIKNIIWQKYYERHPSHRHQRIPREKSNLVVQSFRLAIRLDEVSEGVATDFFDERNNNNYNIDDDHIEWELPASSLTTAPTLSQFTQEHEYDAVPTFFSRQENWLEITTDGVMNVDRYPVGRLTVEDVNSITILMSAWARRHSVQAAMTVEKLLKRVVDDMRASNKVVQVTSRMYTIAIDAWAKSNATGRVQRAQHIHDTLVQMYQQTRNPNIQPSTISYNTLLNAHSKSCEPDAPQKAERVLEEMISLYEQGNENVKPDAITFSTMLDCYSKANPPNSTERSEELLSLMDKLGIQRTVYTFSSLQSVYARSKRPDGPAKAEAILHSMLDLYHKKGDIFAKPNCINYNAVLGALSRNPCRASAQRAHALLQQMELPVSKGGFDVEPDRLSYAFTILCCSRCIDDELYGTTLAEAILLKMEARAKQDLIKKQELSSAAPPLVSIDMECFNVVLTAISKCPQLPDAVARAIAIVRRMEEYAKHTATEYVRPNVRTWNAVLNALSRSKEINAAQKAEQILNHMLDLHRRGIPNVKPDAFSFTAVLSAHQKSTDAGAVQRADDILRRMEAMYDNDEIDAPPDVIHYTIVCGAWARSARTQQNRMLAPDRCVQILTHMMERDQAGIPDVKPNVRTFNSVLDCLSRSNQEDKAERLLFFMLQRYRQGDLQAGPDSFSFNAVINAMTHSRNRESGKRAEVILERLLEYSMHENPRVRPDSRAFTHIIAYYGRSTKPDAPYRAEYLLNRMISLFKTGDFPELMPNNFAISTVIDAYAQAKHPDAGRCAERMLKSLRELQTEYGTAKLVLNAAIMNSVLHAWAVCGDENAGRFAEMHLDEMERKYHDLGKLEVRPDTRSYGLVLHAWSKSSSFDKARRALEVLRRMQFEQTRNNNVFPGEYAYSLVINACAFSDGASQEVQEEAFDIAVSVFDELLAQTLPTSTNFSPVEQTLRPTSLTFGWFLQACGRLKVSEKLKNTNIERAFLSCCEFGLVNDFVLKQFRAAAPEPMYRQLLAPVLSRFPQYLKFSENDDDMINDTDDEDDSYVPYSGSVLPRDNLSYGNTFQEDENNEQNEEDLSVDSLFPPPTHQRRRRILRITMSQLPFEWTRNVPKSRTYPATARRNSRYTSEPDAFPKQ